MTRQVPLVEQDILTFPKHPSSSPVLVGFELFTFYFFCVHLYNVLSTIVLSVIFNLVLVLSVLRVAAFDYPFVGIFKLF